MGKYPNDLDMETSDDSGNVESYKVKRCEVHNIEFLYIDVLSMINLIKKIYSVLKVSKFTIN